MESNIVMTLIIFIAMCVVVYSTLLNDEQE